MGSVVAAWSDASAGDLRPLGTDDGTGGDSALGRWALEVTDTGGSGPLREVHWVEQVHGASVVTVLAPATGGDQRMPAVRQGPADALVSSAPSVALAVLTADCASVALGSVQGVFAAVHCGWRGLIEGVLGEAVDAMRALGAVDVVGARGPCIHAGCYEFSEPDLAAVRAVVGEGAVGRTAGGHPALDLPAAVTAALAASDVIETEGVDACTACQGHYFSHRARRDRGRQALVVWSAPPGVGALGPGRGPDAPGGTAGEGR